MTTTLQELDEVLAKAPNPNQDTLDFIRDSKEFDSFAGIFLIHHAPQIRAALELQAKLEQGFVLVPREPTEQMRRVLYRTRSGFGHDYMTREQASEIWIAMLKAAPPAQGEQDDAR